MADPLSAAASLANIITLGVQLASTIRTYTIGVAGAPTTVSELRKELLNLQNVLKDLAGLPKSNMDQEPFDPESSLFIAVEDCVVKLRGLSVKVESFANGKGLRGVLKRLKWPLDETETRKTLNDLQRYTSLFQFALTVRGSELLSKTAGDIKQQSETLTELLIEQSETAFTVSHILETVSALPDGLEDIKEVREGLWRLQTKKADSEADLHREKVLSSLSTLSFRRRHHDVLRQHQPGTGQWFLDTTNFRSWLEADESSCLWCTGLPGSGKTVITSMVVDYVANLAQGQSVGIGYIYCQYKDAENETALNLVSALALQLAQQVPILPLEVNDFYNNRLISEKQPTVKDYVDLLLHLSDHFAQVYIFVDALDECSEDTRDELLPVLDMMQSFARVFLTSRPHISVDHVLERVSRVNISATDSDIKTYLKAKFSRRGSRLASFISRDPSLEDDIVRMVGEKAGGMFLLARLQMDRIGTQTTPKSIRKTLGTLSSGIKTTYAEAIERIKTQGEENATLAMRVLSWLHSARRDLEVDELLHALAVDDCDNALDPSAFTELDILLSVCAGLVAVDAESHILRLVHFTLQEYLDDNAKQIFPDAPEQLSRTCLKYLSFDVFNEGPCPDDASLAERLQQYRFADYASRYWGIHLKEKLEIALSDQILRYLDDDKRTSSAIQISWQPRLTYKGCYDAFPRKVPKPHIAASWGMELILTQLLDQGADIAGRDSNGKTALHWAVLQGDAPIVRTLIKRGIEVNSQDSWGETALQAAAKYGNVDVVKILIDEGARADVPDQEGDVSLHIAARNGHDGVLRLLLTKDSNVNRKNNLDLTPIHLAAIDGHDRVVRMLLERGADIEATGEAKHTLLHILAFIGEENIARILVENGANVNAIDVHGVPVLYKAARHAKAGFIKLLLDHGAKIDARHTGNLDETVLQSAVAEDNSATLSALLEAGADINWVDEWTRTALFEAAELRKGSTFKLLLDRGADPNMKAKGVWGRAPLHEAARRWEPEYVHALLIHGADPNAQDSDGRTPLHEAASRGHRANVRLLLQHGADPNSKDFHGRTVLQTANHETLDLILNSGAKPGDGQLTLIEAAMFGHEATVKSLLEQGAQVNARGSNGRTALHEAAMCYYRRTNNVRRLLEYGADPGVVDLNTGQTPLHLAAWTGDIETARVLLKHGADPNAETTLPWRGKTALIEAARNASDPQLIKLLLEHGADPNARDHWWHAQETALHCVAINQKVEMLKVLLDYGADTNMKDADGRTPIQKAPKFSAIKRVLEEASGTWQPVNRLFYTETRQELFTGTRKKVKIPRELFDKLGKQVISDESVELKIKPGLRTGFKFKREGVAEEGPQHIFFIVTEKPHPSFTPDKNNINSVVELDLEEAFTGRSRTVFTIDRKYVPLGGTGPTPPGHQVTIPGLGMPKSRSPEERGDFMVTIKVKFPSSLSKDERKSIEQALRASASRSDI